MTPARNPDSAPIEFVVVAVGASSGGLEAVSKLLDTLPRDVGMAFILVQHLDPTHDSMLVDLLGRHTHMTVCQAKEGMPIEVDNLYIIPPGTYLSVSGGSLHLTPPPERHGARLPFDFLLTSLAEAYGQNAVAVILSGNGADGTAGLKAVNVHGGLVIAQSPSEAEYDAMPASAIASGGVELVLPLRDIGEALLKYAVQMAETDAPQVKTGEANAAPDLPAIVALLRAKTAHDYTLYKPGTLQRRVERRMTLASIKPGDMKAYLKLLRRDDAELGLLAKDLLIHVTSFFRDPKVFAHLADTVIPGIIEAHAPDEPLRIWIAGCSTGEEAYSLAILFREALTEAKRNNKLQLFASDADPDAIGTAREGLYSAAISADVSPERLSAFFSKEEDHYRIRPELRSCVVFTVQDVLSDPPFSRIDLISCRNLLIYLGPEAQAKVISLFHFALLQGGLMLLGSSETPGAIAGRFEVVSKANRLYRQIGRSRPGDFGFSKTAWDGVQAQGRASPAGTPASQAAMADLCRQWAIESYAPAVVLVNSKNECLFKLGPISRYLTVPAGHVTADLLSMAPQGLRTSLRSVLQQARRHAEGEGAAHDPAARVTVVSSYVNAHGDRAKTQVDVRSVTRDAERLYLVGFMESTGEAGKASPAIPAHELSRVHELERELDATRTELDSVVHNFELSGEEQKAINEEALSVNEEYQSTNEELLTSKEELQSLNEELTALNVQLQETLDRQRTTANDLQNVLYSTDVATLFLDMDFKIRFFTPATRSLFNIIPGDIGRPLTDLSSLASDGAFLKDAHEVLETNKALDREVKLVAANKDDVWFTRRILPYRTHDQGVEGVVITFTDITEKKTSRKALEQAREQAENANMAKSRFLAAASHDLRQPLQSLALLQGLLAKLVTGEKAVKLVVRLDETLEAMSGMLNTLLDINQFEAGVVKAEKVVIPVDDVLKHMRDEFTDLAEAKALHLTVMPCHLYVETDPALLEQMLRNLLANALKYTKKGGILLGCRRHDNELLIQVHDTGIGIPKKAVISVFEEYYQVDNDSRERSLGLGLGLSIVKRVANLLGHRLKLSSHLGKGSIFSIAVPISRDVAPAETPAPRKDAANELVGIDLAPHAPMRRIMVIEDDPEVRELLTLILESEGHEVIAVTDGLAALDKVANGRLQPDMILADYNLPNNLTGLQAALKIREVLKADVPVCILTGDISTATQADISGHQCVQLNKPVKAGELTRMVEGAMPRHPAVRSEIKVPMAIETPQAEKTATIYVIDDDLRIREAMQLIFEDEGMAIETYSDCETFLARYDPDVEACLLLDAYLPGMSGMDLLRKLRQEGSKMPILMITGDSDVVMAVEAMRAGATDFLEKPVRHADLMSSVTRAMEQTLDSRNLQIWHDDAAGHMSDLTTRQHQIMELVLAGHPNKNIAADLGISQRTVENHRASIMSKTGAKSLPALARLALAAEGGVIVKG